MAERKFFFIKTAIKCKGCLRAWAQKHHFIEKSGKINLAKAHAYATKHHLTKELKRIHLAHELRGFKNPKTRSIERSIKRM